MPCCWMDLRNWSAKYYNQLYIQKGKYPERVSSLLVSLCNEEKVFSIFLHSFRSPVLSKLVIKVNYHYH